MIAVVTDSSSQIPAGLAAAKGVSVIPIPITVDGVEYREGVDLHADDFYGRFVDGVPEVVTSQPSPGKFIELYESLIATGATEIVSIHVGSNLSGTLNSARLAIQSVSIPVSLVDTEMTSFGVAVCALAAAEVVQSGGSAAEVVVAAEKHASKAQAVFTLPAVDYVVRGGRVSGDVMNRATKVPVLKMRGQAMAQVGEAESVDELCDIMAETMSDDGRPIRVAIGTADAPEYSQALEERLRARPDVVEIMNYRVGPSVGAHTGPGTAGGFFWPA